MPRKCLSCRLSLLFASVLMLSCEAREELRILNSFATDETLYQVWPELFAVFQKDYPGSAVAQNVKPGALLYRIQRLYAVQSPPDIIYTDPNSPAGRYLINHKMLQNLRLEQESAYLSQIPFSELALAPQHVGHAHNDGLWVLPLTLQLYGLLFVNDELLAREGLALPEDMQALRENIAKLKRRGYEYPLVLGRSYTDNTLSDLLGVIIGRSISTEFFSRALYKPELFKSPEFRQALELYLSYLAEDGILSTELRSLGKAGLQLFHQQRAPFLLGHDKDIEAFLTGGEDDFHNSVTWLPFPVEKADLNHGGPVRDFVLSGRIQPGYGVTTAAYQKPYTQRRAMEFLDFIFTKGINMYAKEDVQHRIFTVPVKSTNVTRFYLNKLQFYNQIPGVVDDMSSSMIEGEKDVLENTINNVLKGFDSIDKVINVFYTNAMNRTLDLNVINNSLMYPN